MVYLMRYEDMKEIKVKCTKCGTEYTYKNWFHWVWHCPFHWFGKRRVKCMCGHKSYVKREK